MRAKLKTGDKAPDFSLPAVDGRTINLREELVKAPATVVLFICNHCPYVRAYIPRLIELQNEFHSPSKATFIGICSNDASTYPDDDLPHMKTAATDWGLNFAYLRDEDQSAAKAFGAERTPEIFVLDRDGVCRYEGGIDDNYQNPAKVQDRPLREAVLAVAGGQPVKRPQTYAIGCTIKWKKS